MKIEYKLTKLKYNTLIYREVEMLQHQQLTKKINKFINPARGFLVVSMISGNCWEARVSLRGSHKESKKRERDDKLMGGRGEKTTTTIAALTMKACGWRLGKNWI